MGDIGGIGNMGAIGGIGGIDCVRGIGAKRERRVSIVTYFRPCEKTKRQCQKDSSSTQAAYMRIAAMRRLSKKFELEREPYVICYHDFTPFLSNFNWLAGILSTRSIGLTGHQRCRKWRR